MLNRDCLQCRVSEDIAVLFVPSCNIKSTAASIAHLIAKRGKRLCETNCGSGHLERLAALGMVTGSEISGILSQTQIHEKKLSNTLITSQVSSLNGIDVYLAGLLRSRAS